MRRRARIRWALALFALAGLSMFYAVSACVLQMGRSTTATYTGAKCGQFDTFGTASWLVAGAGIITLISALRMAKEAVPKPRP